jgi:hypothetical protein
VIRAIRQWWNERRELRKARMVQKIVASGAMSVNEARMAFYDIPPLKDEPEL